MIVTGIIVLGVAAYAVWAVRKIHRNRKNGSCCGGSCSGCEGNSFISRWFIMADNEKNQQKQETLVLLVSLGTIRFIFLLTGQ